MTELINTFLGNNHLHKGVNGCNIALTSYDNSPDFEDWHAHQNASISFLLNGTHNETLFGRNLSRLPGDVKFIPAGEMHQCTRYSNNAQKINIDLSADFMLQMNNTEEALLGTIPNILSTKITLIKLYQHLYDSSNHADASAELLLYELFNPLNKGLISTGKIMPKWAETLRDLLNDEWNKPLNLTDLAEKTGVHPITISRYFPLYFSTTLGNYLNLIKIDKSLQLIRNTRLPLTEIAYFCGFADQAHFTRTFKAVTGYLPKTFRKI
jgi:AraC family transcriptional regulator